LSFKIQLENWCTIQKYIKINAYYDRPDIYTIFRFPIIATYKIIKHNSTTGTQLQKHFYVHKIQPSPVSYRQGKSSLNATRPG